MKFCIHIVRDTKDANQSAEENYVHNMCIRRMLRILLGRLRLENTIFITVMVTKM